MTIRSQMPELDQGGFPPPPYSQNTPYKLGLKIELNPRRLPQRWEPAVCLCAG